MVTSVITKILLDFNKKLHLILFLFKIWGFSSWVYVPCSASSHSLPLVLVFRACSRLCVPRLQFSFLQCARCSYFPCVFSWLCIGVLPGQISCFDPVLLVFPRLEIMFLSTFFSVPAVLNSFPDFPARPISLCHWRAPVRSQIRSAAGPASICSLRVFIFAQAVRSCLQRLRCSIAACRFSGPAVRFWSEVVHPFSVSACERWSLLLV
jgi:hypothetical protein